MVPRRLCFFGYREGVLRSLPPRGRGPARFLPLAVCVAALALAAGACGGSYNGKTPASSGVQALIAALSSDDPHRAYALLSGEVKAKVSYREFEQQWKQSAAERAWQTAALRDSLRGSPDVGERAIVGYSDGKSVPLERDGKTWRVEAPLVTRAQTPRPRDAIVAFADALQARDVSGALSLLSKRRREVIARQVEGFLGGLGKRVNDVIDEYEGDRAELRWDDAGIRYRILLLREDGEWRIDDLSIRMAPRDESELEDSELDDELRLLR
jgi:hypothetical protein